MIEKYIAALVAEQEELANYVKGKVAAIAFPEQAVKVTQPVASNNHKGISMLCMAGGALALVAGCCIGKGGLSATGGIAIAAGAGLLFMDRNKTSNGMVQREVDFYRVTSYYYKSLSAIYKYVADCWTTALTDLKSQLKADIQQSGLSEEQKNQAIQSVLTTSVVIMSMSDLSKKLSAIEKAKDENGYRQFVSVFERECLAALSTACEEQKAVYGKLAGIVE